MTFTYPLSLEGIPGAKTLSLVLRILCNIFSNGMTAAFIGFFSQSVVTVASYHYLGDRRPNRHGSASPYLFGCLNRQDIFSAQFFVG